MESDFAFMDEALKVAAEARLISPPNPWVGCVIVKEGKIVGKGHSQAHGGSHAEVMALKEAGEHANGATAYVTLEPCSHWGKTPPCTDALIASGIRKVVVALQDPDPKVNGCGIKLLKNSGIHVELGTRKQEAEALLRPYLYQRAHRRPYVLLKGATSLDGRIAAKDHTSQWITNELARADAHRLRAESQAILVGSGTALYDSPSLTVRNAKPPPNSPIRVLADSRGRTPASGPLFDSTLAPTLIFTSHLAPLERIEEWRSTGAEVELLPIDSNGSLSLVALLEALYQRKVIQLLVEGGGTLFGAFVKERLAQQLSICLGPCLLGPEGVPLLSNLSIPTLKAAPRLKILSHELLEDCIRIDYSFIF